MDDSVIGILITVVGLAVVIAMIAGIWKVFEKAGRPRMARKLDPPNPNFNQGLHLHPKLRDLRVGECPGNSTDQTGDAKIVDTAHTSGAPAVHD